MDELFIEACKNDQFERAQHLYDIGNVNIHFNEDEAFILACYNRNLNMAQWLYGLGDVDIRSQNNRAFQNACYMNHYEIVRWLYDLGINIHARDDFALIAACWNGNLEFVKWLHSIGAIDITSRHYEHAIRQALSKGHVDLVKWLYSRYDKTRGYMSEELHDIRKIVMNEKKIYISGILIPLKCNNLINNPMFDKNLMIEFCEYLGYVNRDELFI